MSTSGVRVVPIIAKPQQYAWGKLGKDSEVAKVLSAGGQPVDDSKPYAELWMGTHPTAPSSVLPSPPSSPSPSSPIPLSTYLTHDLPYLFKILSIRSALSIQAHPDIPLAQRLHSSNPKEYRDANHKPEMATSITPFEALCGFRPHAQIVGYLGLVKELREVVGEAVAAAYERAVQGGEEGEMKRQLRAVFTALMTAKEATFVPALHHLLAHLPSTDPYACPPPLLHLPPPPPNLPLSTCSSSSPVSSRSTRRTSASSAPSSSTPSPRLPSTPSSSPPTSRTPTCRATSSSAWRAVTTW